MPDPLSNTDMWTQKLTLIMNPILQYIAKKQGEQHLAGFLTEFRGNEHYWYGAWICALVLLCEDDPTLIPCPQRAVSSSFDDEDNVAKKRSLIPDFTLLRVKGLRQKPPDIPTRRSGRLGQADQPRMDNQEQHRDQRVNADVPRLCVIQKVAALMEIKCPPISNSNASILRGLQEAHHDLTAQVLLFFSKKSLARKKKDVIGIFATGDYWSYRLFTEDNTGRRPMSKNQDPTWRPPLPQARTRDYQDWVYFKLGTPQSDAAMKEMRKAICGLPGSSRFNPRR